MSKITRNDIIKIENMADETTAGSEAIMFAEWITENDYKPRTKNEWCRYENGDIIIYNSTQLYRIYKDDWRQKIIAKTTKELQGNRKRAKESVRFPYGK